MARAQMYSNWRSVLEKATDKLLYVLPVAACQGKTGKYFARKQFKKNDVGHMRASECIVLISAGILCG